MFRNVLYKIQKFSDLLMCPHCYKFVTGQKVYFTKYEYDQYCTLCGAERLWEADIMCQDLLDELDRTRQGVYNELITEYEDIPPEVDKFFSYKGYYIYRIHNKRWRVKYDEDDTFAINDGSFKSRDLAIDFIDHYDYDREMEKMEKGEL